MESKGAWPNSATEQWGIQLHSWQGWEDPLQVRADAKEQRPLPGMPCLLVLLGITIVLITRGSVPGPLYNVQGTV